MTKSKKIIECCTTKNSTAAGAGIVYCLGFVGAVIYYIQIADGFWIGFLGFLKALVWPVFLVYELMRFLGT
ncbi:hypothetical protein ACFL14_01670 [Patescibacteria group bacterium]